LNRRRNPGSAEEKAEQLVQQELAGRKWTEKELERKAKTDR